MKTKFTQSAFLILMVLGTISSFSARAQGDIDKDAQQITVQIPSVAILDLETTGTKNFNAQFTHSTEAGDKITAPAFNNDTWLNYSVIQSGSTAKKIHVASNATVSGVTINLTATESASGAGTLGTPAATLILSSSPQTVVGAIGSSYTVSGASKGHQLKYEFSAADGTYAALRSGDTILTVTYTMVDDI